MMEYIAVFSGGLLGSAHCIGMCGPLAAAIGASDKLFWLILRRQLIYSAGRIATYAFLGAVGGAVGMRLGQFRTPLIGVQQAFSILAGLIMLYVALSVLGLIPFQRRKSCAPGGLLAPLFTHFLSAPGPFGFFTAGLATGFLPCGLVYSFLAMAVAGGAVLHGMALMACFGLGTVPAMVLVGCGGNLLGRAARARVMQAAACFIFVMGIASIVRALPGHRSHHAHHAHVPATTVEPIDGTR